MKAARRPRPLREIWKSTKLTPFERIMAWLGWTRADIIRAIPCAWCGEVFHFEGDTAADPPRFCCTGHKTAANKARTKRVEETEKAQQRGKANRQKKNDHVEAPPPQQLSAITDHRIVTPPPPKKIPNTCICTNHMGTAKVRYATNEAAAVGLMRRHVSHGRHWIYRCPDSDCWHITSRDQAKQVA